MKIFRAVLLSLAIPAAYACQSDYGAAKTDAGGSAYRATPGTTTTDPYGAGTTGTRETGRGGSAPIAENIPGTRATGDTYDRTAGAADTTGEGSDMVAGGKTTDGGAPKAGENFGTSRYGTDTDEM